jgi:hypothetical protein
MEEKKEFDKMMSETKSPHTLKETIQSTSQLSEMSRNSDEITKQKPNGISITPPAQVMSLGTLFQYHPAPKKEKKQKQDPGPPHPPQPQRPILQPIQSTQSTQPSHPIQSFQSIQPSHPIHPFQPTQPTQPFELIQLSPLEAEHASYPPSPVLEERRKLEEEKARLEEERNQLQEAMQKLQDQQRRLEERRKIEAERRKIDDERKQVEVERKKIEEEKQKIEEANRKIEEEEASRKIRENKRLQQEQLQQEHQRRLNLRHLMGNDYNPQLRHPQQRQSNNGLIQSNSPLLKPMDDLVQRWPSPQQQSTNDSQSSPQRVSSKRQSNLSMAPRYVFERQQSKDDVQTEPPPRSQLRSTSPQRPANPRRSNSVTTTPAGNASNRTNQLQLKNGREPPSRSVTAPTVGIYSQQEWTDSHPRLPFPGRYI